MAINQRADGKWTVTCRDDQGSSRFAVRDTRPLAEAFFIFTAGQKSCGVVPRFSFAGLVEWFRLDCERQRVKSGRKYYNDLNNHAVPHFGEKSIASVTLADLYAMRASMIAGGKAVETANGVFRRVRALYHHAHGEGRIAANPVSPEMGRIGGVAKAIRHGARYVPRPVKVPDETKYDLLRQVADPHLRAAMDLIGDWVTFSELRVLEKTCLDLERRCAVIKRAWTTEGVLDYPRERWREVALSPPTVASLRRLEFEILTGPTVAAPERSHMVFALDVSDERFQIFADMHEISGPFAPENLFCRTVIRAIAQGKSAFEIAKRAGRHPKSISRRFHVAFRRRTARGLLVPMNANLARFLA